MAGVVRGEHDIVAPAADPAAQVQFGDGTAVEAETHAADDFEDSRVGQGLDRVIFTKALDAGKGRLQSLAVALMPASS